MIPWFFKFIKNCSKKNMMHTARYMHQILNLAMPAYDELFQDIDISGLIENKGIIYFWNKTDLKSRELEINIRNEYLPKVKTNERGQLALMALKCNVLGV